MTAVQTEPLQRIQRTSPTLELVNGYTLPSTLITKMPPPSQLSIATSSVNRLVKEEASYYKELEQQQARIAKLEQDGGDENAEFQMKQEVRILPACRLEI